MGVLQKSAKHIKRAMRQIDQIHNAENQRQTGCHQEQYYSKLKTVKKLFCQKNVIHLFFFVALLPK